MSELKLDIGCGGRGSRQAGFIGIDVWPLPDGKTPEEYYRLDFVHDTLPWDRGTVDEAIALHIVEHLSPADGEQMIRRAVDLLKPGATLTVTCPDLRKLCAAYLTGDSEFLGMRHLNGGKEVWPGPTLADRLNWAIHQDTHLWSYDGMSLVTLARRATAADVRLMPSNWKWWTRPDHECGIVITKGAL